MHLPSAYKYSLCKSSSKPPHRGDPIASAELRCHKQLPGFRVRGDSRWIPTLHVYLRLEAVRPTHPQGGHFPREIFQGMQFALVLSVSPWVRTGALPSMQAAAVISRTASPCNKLPGLSVQQPQVFLASNPGHLLTALCHSDSAFHFWLPNLPLTNPE